MPDFLSFDPTTGVRKLFDYEDGKSIIRTEQDVQPLLERNLQARNENIYDSPKATFRFYCSIPAVVQMELKKMGIDIYSKEPSMIKRMFRVINTQYPYLKVTDKKHE